MSSATEAEIGTTFLNAKDDLPIHTTLKEIGYSQPPATIKVDKTAAFGFANNIIIQKQSK